MKKSISESDVEQPVLTTMQSLGYEVARGDREDYLPGGSLALRNDYREVVLSEKLQQAL